MSDFDTPEKEALTKSIGRRNFIRLSVLSAVVLPNLGFQQKESSESRRGNNGDGYYDVVVYGGTPGGIAAAVAVAREGKSVIVVEPLTIIGGMMSGGLSFSDSSQMPRETLGGIFEEFHLRVEKHYTDRGVVLPYKVSIKEDGVPWTYEPHVAERVFWQLLNEANVQVLMGETLKKAKKKGKAITSITTYSGKKISGKMFVDASYEGDLMAAAGVRYRVGRESRSEFNEGYAGALYQKEQVKFSALDADGKPLPFVTDTVKSKEGEGDKRIMTYSFRFCFSTDPNNMVPFTRPADYDAGKYELFRRYLKAYPQTDRLFDMYPMPGNKFDGNNGIQLQLSIGLVGGSDAYPDAKPEERSRIWAAHKSYSEGLFYFLMTDEAVPAAIREKMKKLGYAKDEFVQYKHFPPVLYVREARRMVGAYFLTQADVLENIKKEDSVGIGSFPIDSHDCQRIAVSENEFVTEGMIFPLHIKGRRVGQPYEIPYRAITPNANECTNLLVPSCLSASHVALSSIRVEPTWIVLGQSAGIAACVAIEDGVVAQDVDYKKLSSRLEKRGQIISLSKFKAP